MDLDQLKKLSGLKFQLSVRDLSSILARENELGQNWIACVHLCGKR
jgi:hypothetical protein